MRQVHWIGAVLFLFAQEAKLVEFKTSEHNFGKLKEEDRSAKTSFTFKNTSKDPVRIQDVKTSCGCTTPSWSKEVIAPGAEGFVEAQYSTWGRPGPFTKTITVTLRSQKDTTRQQVTILTIRGEVLPRPKGPEDWYPTKLGNLRFGPSNHLAFGTIKNNESRNHSLTVYNDGKEAITLKPFKNLPPHLQIQYRTSKGNFNEYTLQPKDTVQIVCFYDAKKVDDYGFVYHTLTLETTDASDANKTLYVTANIEEYFSPMTEEQLAQAPHIEFEQTQYNYGQIKAGEKVVHEFKFKNTGKSELIIRKTKTTCGCTVSAPDKQAFKPGESGVIKATFDSTGRQGRDSKTITVYTNDPRQPVTNLVLTGEITPPATK
ncbi:MAG: DUF1573 domain-containing protein [Bacteroidia bacterium]